MRRRGVCFVLGSNYYDGICVLCQLFVRNTGNICRKYIEQKDILVYLKYYLEFIGVRCKEERAGELNICLTFMLKFLPNTVIPVCLNHVEKSQNK